MSMTELGLRKCARAAAVLLVAFLALGAGDADLEQRRMIERNGVVDALNKGELMRAQELVELWQEWDVDGEATKYQGIIYYSRGMADKSSNLVAQSVRLMNRWISDNPADAEAVSILAQAYSAMGNYDEAMAQYRGLILKNPEDINALLRLSELQAISGDAQTALATLVQAQELNPNIGGIWGRMAQLHNALRQPEKAIYALRKQVSQMPTNSNHWVGYAGALSLFKERREEQLLSLRVLIDFVPEHIQYSETYFQLLMQVGRSSAAVNLVLSSPIKIAKLGTALPGDVRTVLRRKGSARSSYIAAWLQREPDSAWAWALHGYDLHHVKKDAVAAIDALKKASALSASLVFPYYVLWDVYSEQPLQQVEVSDAALGIVPGDLEWQFKRAEAMYNAQQYSKSITAYTQVLKLFDLHPTAWYQLVDALILTGRKADAVEIYLKLQKDFPGVSEQVFQRIAYN